MATGIRSEPCEKKRIVQCELDHTALSGARPQNLAEETDQWFGRPPGQGCVHDNGVRAGSGRHRRVQAGK
jgi:hypothetical protein